MQPMRLLTPAVSSAFAPLHQSDGWGYRVLAAGWWLFIAAFFLAPDKHALRMTFYVAVVVPALIWSHRIVREIDWRDPLWLSILATLVFLSASAFWGADRADEHALRAMKIMVFLVLCFLVPRFLAGAGLLTIRHLLGAILALATIVACSNLILNLLPVLSGKESFLEHTRLGGWGQYDNPLQYGGIVGGSALLALCEFYRETRRQRQIVLLLVLGLLTLSLVLTMSRGPILYFLAAAAVVAAIYRVHWRRTLLLLLLASAIALPILLHPTAQAMLEYNASRPSHRPAIWSAVMAEMNGKELFGQGWRDDQSVQTAEMRFGHPHNFLLGIYRFGGFVGLALFVAMTGLLFYRCARLRRDIAAPLGAWLLYGVCLHLTNGRFHVSAPGNDWFFYWLPAALIFGFDRRVGQPPRTVDSSS
jgi:O-antigen ligase